MLLFAIVLIVSVALVAGTMPAVYASSAGLSDGLKQSARGASRAHIRMRRTIVSMELALSFVLVCGALLLGRSLWKMQQVDTGVRIDNILTTSIELPLNAYATPEKAALFYEALEQRLRAIRGIRRVGLSTTLPLQWISNGEAIQTANSDKLIRVRLKRVDAGYFRTFGIPVLAGRGITDQDRAGAPLVVIINQALAKRLDAEAGIQNPIGKVVRLSVVTYQKEHQVPFQIAGMIRSERTTAPGVPDPPVAYVPLAQEPVQNIKLSIQTDANNGATLADLRDAIHAIDPNLPLETSAPMRQLFEQTLLPASQPGWLAVSLYSLCSWQPLVCTVSCRT